MRFFLQWLFLFFICSPAVAQVLTVMPEFPTTDDTVTIIYNAQLGNGELAGYTGEVFAHTGVITSESSNPSDWKHVVDNWGTFDSTTLMESLGNDLYRIKYHIRTFYGVATSEQVLSLAFVFRNQNGTLVGRSEDNTDIFYSINQQVLTNYVSHTVINNVLTIFTDSSSIKIQPFNDHIFRISLETGDGGNPDSSFSVVMQPATFTAVLDEASTYLEFVAGDFKVHVDKFPLRLTFLYNADTLLQDDPGLYKAGDGAGVRFKINPDEHLYGTGSRAIDIDRHGKKLTSYNTAQYGYSNGTQTLNICIPFVTSSRGYGLYIDNYSPGIWDLGNSAPSVLEYAAEAGALSYFVVAGTSNQEILENYTLLTGRQPLPPRWALGYIQSKYGYQQEDEARNIVNLMRTNNFPLDALVLDLYWFGSPSTMGNLNWDYTKFPTPVDMMHDFDSLGVKTICITEPYITLNSNNYSYAGNNEILATDINGNNFVVGNFWAGPAGLMDMFNSSSQDWMWNYYDDRMAEGVTGWWCDLGEPENHPAELMHSIGMARTVHNVYSLIWAEMLFNKYQQYHPGKRLFNLIRSGYAGMQRYSTFPWSGDIQRSFDGLKAQIPIMLGESMCGIGYMHSDIGGFTGGGQNEELYVRWMEFGSFCPVMRAHGEGVPTEPVYYSTNAKNTIRKYSNLRHQLTPYNYSLAYQNSLKGTPLALPLNFFEPDNQLLANINDEYLWGENFLVAPVLSQGQTSRSVIFPEGKWISYWNNAVYDGNTAATVSASLDVMPLFVKAGSFIPLVPLVKTLAEYNTDTMMVKYYPDNSNPNTSFTVYDDDGEDANAMATGNHELISFGGNVTNEETAITLIKSGNGFNGAPSSREMNFQLQRISNAPLQVLKNSMPLPITATINDFNMADSAAFWDQAAQVLYIHFKWEGEPALIQILSTGVGIAAIDATMPDFTLGEPIPNPFKDFITIPYRINHAGNYSMEISDLSGAILKCMDLDHISAGDYEQCWAGTDELGHPLKSGLYILQLKNEKGCEIKKLMKVN